jgi:hypothetical protein
MPKRTRKESQDINQFAAAIVRQSTEQPGPVDLTDQAAISQVMRAMGRRGGLKGAATLNARLTPAQRRKSAQRAAQARWGKKG